jgi:ATPase subunit of ABC transporter with duplicated ATPase domains
VISVDKLTMRYGGRTLFEDISLQFYAGSRYGLVGANGAGKSTLLRLLVGEEEPTSGLVNRPNQMRLGVLRQDHYRHERERIIDVVMAGRERLWTALAEKDQLLAADHFDDATGIRLAELEEVIAHEDGYAAEGEAGAILDGLGIPTRQHDQPLATLSGGFKLRVLLGRMLFGRPDVMLLDEPTNHLDIISIRWLENHLLASPATVIVASHDQHFLNVVCTHIVDVDYSTVTVYTGNYDRFVDAKVLDRDQREAAIKKQERRRDELDRFVTRFKAKASKARQAQSKAKQIERLDQAIVDLPISSRRFPNFAFNVCRHSGVAPLKVTGLTKTFGDRTVLEDVSFELARGDRVAIIGPNGIGKSTLLKILIGQVVADAGAYEWGYETHIGYFPQDHAEQVHGAHTCESWCWQFAPGDPIGKIRSILARALFSGDEVEKKVNVLSGGESGRLILAKLMLTSHNILVLDEPTNHLDLEAIDQLATSLAGYTGTVLFVSHHRHFVHKIASRILEISADGVRDYRGTYAEYLADCGSDYLDRQSLQAQLPAIGVERIAPAATAVVVESRNTRTLRKQVEKLEGDVSRLEARCSSERARIATLPPLEQIAAYDAHLQLERELELAVQAWASATEQLEAQ